MTRIVDNLSFLISHLMSLLSHLIILIDLSHSQEVTGNPYYSFNKTCILGNTSRQLYLEYFCFYFSNKFSNENILGQRAQGTWDQLSNVERARCTRQEHAVKTFALRIHCQEMGSR